MAQYFDRFSDYTTGPFIAQAENYAEFEGLSSSITSNGQLQLDLYAESGQALGVITYGGLSNNTVMDIYAQGVDINNGRIAVGFLLDNPPIQGAESGYVLDKIHTGPAVCHLRISRLNSGSSSATLVRGPDTVRATLLNIHAQISLDGSGNVLIKGNLWPSTSDEPIGWQIEYTDESGSAITPPFYPALVGRGFTGNPVTFTEFGVGTNGDPAPTEPVDEQITLSVDSISLLMTMDSATLTQTNQLTVDDLQCQTSIDAVTLQQANVLSPDALSLTTQLADVSLISTGQLSVNDLQLTMAIEVTELQQANQLSVDNLMLSTTFESPDLSVGLTLVPDSIWLSALLDHVSLTQSHLLTVDDLTQSISLGNVTLSVAGQVIGPGTLTIGITGPSTLTIGITGPSISIGISP